MMMNPMQNMLAPMVQGAMERVMNRYAPQHTTMPGMDEKAVFRKRMAEYWDDVVAGREQASEEMVTGFCMLMMEVLPQCMEKLGVAVATDSRPHCGDAYKSRHKRFKEEVDRLRRTPMQDRAKVMGEIFPTLKSGSKEYKVLMEKLKWPTTEAKASQLGMTKDEYCEANDNLKQMLD